MNGTLIVVDYILQVVEITGRFSLEDMYRAKDLLDRFTENMNIDDYLKTVGIVNRFYELMKGAKK